jgi:hypothetical protein
MARTLTTLGSKRVVCKVCNARRLVVKKIKIREWAKGLPLGVLEVNAQSQISMAVLVLLVLLVLLVVLVVLVGLWGLRCGTLPSDCDMSWLG